MEGQTQKIEERKLLRRNFCYAYCSTEKALSEALSELEKPDPRSYVITPLVENGSFTLSWSICHTSWEKRFSLTGLERCRKQSLVNSLESLGYTVTVP
jgi:hypothetical protein